MRARGVFVLVRMAVFVCVCAGAGSLRVLSKRTARSIRSNGNNGKNSSLLIVPEE